MKRLGCLLAAGLLAAGVLAAVTYERDLSVAELAADYGGPASRFLELAGASVHYRDQGSGPVLLLLHGFGSSLHTWDDWAAELGGDFRLVRLDLPGFGLTGPFARRDYRAERYVELLDAFLEELGVDRCSIAGNSMGGFFAWRYALRHPARVDRLVLIDASGYPDMPGGSTVSIARVPVLKDLMTTFTPRFLFARALREAYADDSRIQPELIDRHFRLALRAGNRQALVDRLAAAGEDLLSERIPEIRQPALVMWGEGDLWIPVRFGHRFHADLPRSELVIYPGVGHVPMEEAPARSARDARAFLLGPETPASEGPQLEHEAAEHRQAQGADRRPHSSPASETGSGMEP